MASTSIAAGGGCTCRPARIPPCTSTGCLRRQLEPCGRAWGVITMKRQSCVVAAGMTVAFAFTSVRAADTSEPGTILVTATRYAEPLDAVLPATFVIQRDELERTLADDVADVLRFRSGFELGRNG